MFIWEDALSHAARMIANSEGACSTNGNNYGARVQEVLLRYFAHDYEDLEILRFAYKDLPIFKTDLSNPINFILGQKCIDKSILKSHTNLHMGIGCSCSVTEGYICYVLTTKSVTPSINWERIPFW